MKELGLTVATRYDSFFASVQLASIRIWLRHNESVASNLLKGDAQMQALNIRTEIIETILNHLSGTKSGIARVYQCHDYQEEKRQAMKAWGRHIKKLTAA